MDNYFKPLFEDRCDDHYHPPLIHLNKQCYEYAQVRVLACQGIPEEKLTPMVLANALDGLVIAEAEINQLKQRIVVLEREKQQFTNAMKLNKPLAE